jgi:D-threo-aldose 1-dehydrogenase
VSLIAPASWPRLGLGCAALGQPDVREHDAEATIARAFERGIRFFDVAPLYGGGLGEERLGRALRGVPRDDYVLCTKTGVTRPHAQAATPPGATRARAADQWNYSAAATRESVMQSLERLGSDHLDVVHLHDVDDHLDACLDAHAELTRLRDEGVVGAIGIGSNATAPVATLLARARFDTFLLAGCYTLLDQSGAKLIEDSARAGIAVVAGGIYNSGILSRWPPVAPTYAYQPAKPAIVERAARISAACARHGTTLPEAALQFVMANPSITTVLLGPRSVDELEQNLAAATAPLPPQFLETLEREGLLASAGVAA